MMSHLPIKLLELVDQISPGFLLHFPNALATMAIFQIN